MTTALASASGNVGAVSSRSAPVEERTPPEVRGERTAASGRGAAGRGHDVRLVRRRDHPAVARTDPEVVLSDLPAPGLGAVAAPPLPDAAPSRSSSGWSPSRRTPPASAPQPRQLAWVDLLRELAAQVEQGAVYDRHLAAIAAALDDVMRAVHRRGGPALRSRSVAAGVTPG